MKKERNGKKHIKHACRFFEPSEQEDKVRKYIEYVLNGKTKNESERLSGLGKGTSQGYILPSIDLWESLPEKGRGSKYTYIKYMMTFGTVRHLRGGYSKIMDHLVAEYVGHKYDDIMRKAEKFDALLKILSI